MATFIPAPQDPLAIGIRNLGIGAGQGIGNLLQQRRQAQGLQQDLTGIQQFLLGQQTPGGPQLPIPTVQTPTGQNILSQLLLQQATPQPKFSDPFPLPGGGLAQTGPQGRITPIPGTASKPASVVSVITDPSNPDQAIRVRDTFDASGQLINRTRIGEATLAERIGGVAEAGLQRGTRTRIEKDIIDLDQTLSELGAIESQFNEDFFTFRGKGKAFFTALAEKAEIPVSKAQQQFLKDRTAFFADSKRSFLKFRKFITGVAGGIQEFREIAKATIDPETDSPTQFMAKWNSMRDNALRTKKVLEDMARQGLDPNDPVDRKLAFSQVSLKDVPLDNELDEAVQQEQTATNPQTGERLVFRNGQWQPIE